METNDHNNLTPPSRPALTLVDDGVVAAELVDGNTAGQSPVTQPTAIGQGRMFDSPGAWEPGLTPAGGDATAPAGTAATLAPAAPTRLSAVLAEIARLQERKAGWGSGVLILGVSLLLFFGTGAARWSWQFALMLIPILFLHELGHYLAMRVFQYRNLRMFFIPLFGAAVSGQHYNVPGWKKALVSLAGPLPGIVLGLILGLLAIVLQQQALLQAALLTIVVNGFNLVPFLPFDGGWVMHAILFSRHYVLDVAFRALAIVVLIGFGLLISDRFLPVLGVIMLFGLPTCFRVSRISTCLRGSGLASASPDGQTVPPATAQVILEHIQQAFPTGLNLRTQAQLTLNVFENLNAHPPGLPATLGLAALHGAGLFGALLFGAVLLVAQQAMTGN